MIVSTLAMVDIYNYNRSEMTKKKGYPGSKGNGILIPNILNLFPPHKVYWELCMGSGAVMKAKKPAAISIGVEINPEVAAFYAPAMPAGSVVVNGCSISLAACLQHVSPDHLIYADPPYPFSVRRSQVDIYANEWSDEDHRRFLGYLYRSRCNVVVSSYENELYDNHLPGWNKKRIGVCVHGSPRVECLYYNFSVKALHQYDHVGDNKTDRQRIRRKIERWAARLRSLPAVERNAILAHFK